MDSRRRGLRRRPGVADCSPSVRSRHTPTLGDIDMRKLRHDQNRTHQTYGK
ncbi:hypothetical protein MLP_45830 [Microlunatus phosphovorus NM-1]|uniref:Uncharacterized protein n=1 Tax=Microlunatus phosphovorus (strain ATCC 700054 / DSM 10555 / JCM 9379 / NBRC 101784 / NCIMB 13414 / VKM Ac-1990 / NM-1) TaxID=1032480 RepID=F5XE49_MICPN|nr:hypothetical protein MLP_45830 [Microlunatus phosphovorus NM-1]